MAYKDTIHILGRSEPALNIRWVIGPGAENGPADVKLIQAMFNYLSYIGTHRTRRFTGLSISELPAINGRCDHKTESAILKFQIRHAKILQNVDGLVHPAVYDGRKLSGSPRYMTITLLHLLASEAVLHNPEPTYFDGLIKLAPELRAWLT